MNQEKVGKFIAEMRRNKGLTQEDVAKHFGITSQAISKWERGLTAPDISILKELAKILGVEVIDILNGELSSLKKNNVDETMINSIEFYENKTKKKYGKICCILSCIFVFSITIILLLYSVNNYNKVNVYSISSQDTLLMSGKIFFNPRQNSLTINKIIYDDIYSGTDLEMLVKGVNIKIGTDKKVYIEIGNLNSLDSNEVKTINDYLTEISITNIDSYTTEGDYIKENDLDNLKVIIEYADENETINFLEYPVFVSKEFSNTKLFY